MTARATLRLRRSTASRTLVEFMIVIAIIAILLTIAIPTPIRQVHNDLGANDGTHVGIASDY